MDISDAFKRLLEDSFFLAGEVNTKLTTNLYTTTGHRSFAGIEFPYIEVDDFEQILILLKDLGKLNTYALDASAVATQNGTMGILINDIPDDEQEPIVFSIKIDEQRSDCWHRFILLKEICQIYCDFIRLEKKQIADSIESQVYGLIDRHIQLRKDPETFTLDPLDENYTEFLSFYLAINLTFPKHFWEQLKTLTDPLRNESNGCKYKFYDVADAFKMPEFIVQYFVKKLLPIFEKLN